MSKLILVKAGAGYSPNWNDPRIQRRLESVLSWCANKLDIPDGFKCHHDTLINIFGPSGNKLGKYLRSKLLMQYGYFVPRGKSYIYRINNDGYEALVRHLKSSNPSPDEFTAANYRERFADELSGKKPIEYDIKSDRRWHPLINIKRDLKPLVFKGYFDFDYDISAAAPTILFQLTARLNPDLNMAEKFPAIHFYTTHKALVRSEVEAATGIEPTLVKRLINGVFNGARLVAFDKCTAFKLLNRDSILLDAFKEHPHVKSLVRDVRRLWIWLLTTYNMKQWRLDTSKLVPKKKRFLIYFREERRVMDCVADYLDRGGVRFLLEHDGFRTDRKIELSRLVAYIKEQTGYELKFD